jgi:hypothetical protein
MRLGSGTALAPYEPMVEVARWSAATQVHVRAQEARLVRGAYDGLYERVDKVLRELANPNLHDIANMSFHVELWDRHANHLRWVVTAAGNLSLAQAAFDAASREWPDHVKPRREGGPVTPDGNPTAYKSRFLAKALPECDFRYRSNSSALYLSAKARYQVNSHGRYFAV